MLPWFGDYDTFTQSRGRKKICHSRPYYPPTVTRGKVLAQNVPKASFVCFSSGGKALGMTERHPWFSRDHPVSSHLAWLQKSRWQLSMSEDVNNDSSSSKVDEKKIVVEFCQLQEKSRQLFNALRFFTYLYYDLYYFLHGMSLLQPVRLGTSRSLNFGERSVQS